VSKGQRVEVENINVPGRISQVDAEKYEVMRGILLSVLPRERPGFSQAEMHTAVLPHLPRNLWPNGAKSMWWVKAVQLDLEAKGLVVRNHEAGHPVAPYLRAQAATHGMRLV
jgi:hypothetical protein